MLKKEQMQFPMLEKNLEHQTTKAKKKFCLRPYREGDESGMLECIRDEYGESYFKRDFYDLVKLRVKAQGDHYVFFVAETDGEIVGMEIFALFYENGDDYIEPASQILKRCVRGYGLAWHLILARSKNGKGTLTYSVDDKGVYFEFEAPKTVDGDKALELV
ncbi:MAG: hypothetical protein J6B28_02680, partial [Eubacterium sp.]|nr:hypothetical protein [Eubacterium sp.]